MSESVSSILYSGNAWYIEEMYEAYLADPKNVSERLQFYFKTFKFRFSVNGFSEACSAHASNSHSVVSIFLTPRTISPMDMRLRSRARR